MFFYLSFLRPPPTACTTALSITPQVANDLRTELFEGDALDIYYQWISVKTGEQTRPAKLTTWRGQASAYKEIPVPLPRGPSNGLWRLVLTTTPDSFAIPMDENNIGVRPFGVMSMPVQLGSGQSFKGKAKLQDRIERVYALGGDKCVNVIEETSFDLDKKIWDSGIGLSSWLVANQLPFLKAPNPLRILELGAGTGIVSLVLGCLRPEDHIIATDVESAMPLLQHNISENKSTVKAAVLDWDENHLPESVQQSESFDVLIMADVTYNTASFPSLVGTLKRVMTMGPLPPQIILGYKERDAAERELWSMLRDENNIELKQIATVDGSGGMPIEIWTS